MAISIFPLLPDFGAEIGDVDLARPLSAEDREAIKAAFWKYGVLVFPAQTLTQEQHIAFAEVFGPMEPSINTYQDDVKKDRIDNRISDVSNLDHDNEILAANSRKRMSGLANRLWHTDSIFRHVPARASLLYARSVAPIGGHTQFADMRAAWDALPQAMKGSHLGSGRRAFDLPFARQAGIHRLLRPGARVAAPAIQVLVRTIPETGRRSLYIASHAMRIMGMPQEEGTRLLEELMAHATQRQFVYTHRWRLNDLVMWDNRCTMHRGTEFEERRWKRDMQRATVSDIGNTCEPIQRSEASAQVSS